jgi:hypothetical protein
MDKDKYQQDDGGGNVATGQPVGLSSGKGIAPSFIPGKRAMPFLILLGFVNMLFHLIWLT